MTPSQARNAIKRSLQALIDPKPTAQQKHQIWDGFQHQCAFCGCSLNQSQRQGHIDHLIPESQGGTNRLANLILTCAPCNGDEKLDKDWQAFLKYKCDGDLPLYEQRLACILHWQQSQPGPVTLSPAQQQQLNDAFAQVNTVYSSAVAQLRAQNKNTQ